MSTLCSDESWPMREQRLFKSTPQSRQSDQLFLQSSDSPTHSLSRRRVCPPPPPFGPGGGGGVGGVPIPARGHTLWTVVLYIYKYFVAVLRIRIRIRIRIHRIHMFLGLLDPDPDPLVRGYGSFYHQAKIVRKTLIPIFLLLFLTFYL